MRKTPENRVKMHNINDRGFSLNRFKECIQYFISNATKKFSKKFKQSWIKFRAWKISCFLNICYLIQFLILDIKS